MFVTGIKPTGDSKASFHLGNYASVVPPIKNLLNQGEKGFLFLADVHALNECRDSKILQENSKKMLATLLAFFQGTDLLIYRQSKISNLFKLNALLQQFVSKGLLNRAHAYKAKVAANLENKKDPDYKINMGLFNYPSLMAVDILATKADKVPVGPDQVQHIEITKEIVRTANKFFKKSIFKEPDAILYTPEVLPGIDGARKMSKSYGNVIPVFENETKLRKLVFSIPTNSKNVGEPKLPDESAVCQIYKVLSSSEEFEKLVAEMNYGLGWGDVKQKLFEKILEVTNKPKQVYNELMSLESLDSLVIENEKQVNELIHETVKEVEICLGL